MLLKIAKTWDGGPAKPEEVVELELGVRGRALEIRFDAPFHGDPAPPGPVGVTAGLWNFEVVEVFLLGAAERYLEVELGPHGHYLALSFEGARQLCRSDLSVSYAAQLEGRRWRGRAQVAPDLLPVGLDRANAYAIHGVGEQRRYLAMHPVPGPAPDFHRIDRFPTWSPPLGLEPLGRVY